MLKQLIFVNLLMFSCNESEFEGSKAEKQNKKVESDQKAVAKKKQEPEAKKLADDKEDLSNQEVTAENIKEKTDDVKSQCADLQKQVLEQKLKFGKEAKGCWGDDYTKYAKQNKAPTATVGKPKNGYLTAMVEQSQKINLPDGAILCDLKLDFGAQQKIYFDDHINFTLNNIVLAGSSTSSFELLPKVDDLKIWDFSKIRDSKFINETIYCIGTGNTCVLPKTQTTGKFELVFSDDSIKKAFLAGAVIDAVKYAKPVFSVITTGDNDGSIDCLHSPIEIDAKVEYVMP